MKHVTVAGCADLLTPKEVLRMIQSLHVRAILTDGEYRRAVKRLEKRYGTKLAPIRKGQSV
jgi:hypothetical protein